MLYGQVLHTLHNQVMSIHTSTFDMLEVHKQDGRLQKNKLGGISRSVVSLLPYSTCITHYCIVRIVVVYNHRYRCGQTTSIHGFHFLYTSICSSVVLHTRNHSVTDDSLFSNLKRISLVSALRGSFRRFTLSFVCSQRSADLVVLEK